LLSWPHHQQEDFQLYCLACWQEHTAVGAARHADFLDYVWHEAVGAARQADCLRSPDHIDESIACEALIMMGTIFTVSTVHIFLKVF
jgi:hypothetical protein